VEFWDLEIAFDIRDAESGKPIANAIVTVIAEVDEDCVSDQRNGRLNTNEKGEAKHIWPHRMVAGTTRGSESTFAINLPSCIVAASAEGYDYSKPLVLKELDQKGHVDTEWHDKLARLRIPIYLKKLKHDG
jgi:hypothetical protein